MNNIRAQERQKYYYDAKHDSNHVSDVNNVCSAFIILCVLTCSAFQSWVKSAAKNMRHSHRTGGKLDIKWNGPYIVKAKLTKGRYQLQSSSGVVLKQLPFQRVF